MCVCVCVKNKMFFHVSVYQLPFTCDIRWSIWISNTAYIYIYVHTHVYTYVCTYTHIHISNLKCAYTVYIHIDTHASMHVCIYTYIHTQFKSLKKLIILNIINGQRSAQEFNQNFIFFFFIFIILTQTSGSCIHFILSILKNTWYLWRVDYGIILYCLA